MPFLVRWIDGILFVLLRSAARYRFHVIQDNLKIAFNESAEKDLKRDLRKYYWFLGTIIRQTIVNPGRKLLAKRMRLEKLPEIDHWLAEGKSVIVDMAHIGNWEWAGHFLGHQYPGYVCALYKRIKSERVDQWMLRRRQQGVEYMIEISKMTDLIRLIREKPVIVLMISDQNPGNDHGIIWADFFQRRTAFVNGPETLSNKYGLPVVYLHTEPRENDGYQLSFKIITDGVQKTEPGFITSTYASLLESNIKSYRHGWLWSHKRWKRNPAGRVTKMQ